MTEVREGGEDYYLDWGIITINFSLGEWRRIMVDWKDSEYDTKLSKWRDIDLKCFEHFRQIQKKYQYIPTVCTKNIFNSMNWSENTLNHSPMNDFVVVTMHQTM